MVNVYQSRQTHFQSGPLNKGFTPLYSSDLRGRAIAYYSTQTVHFAERHQRARLHDGRVHVQVITHRVMAA